ncbi:MAG TPA: hypothetical protein VKP04_04380 [Ktedonobacteraceae bacterium]|nr:hypothetical protein [Ktedonobacteraceae bacterium]
MKAKMDRRWFWRIVDFINPLRDPSLTVAVVLTFIEEAGQRDTWYWIIIIGLVNWLAVRGVVWLVVNFTFASTFIARRTWWAIKHPRLAWRILDAVGHEEIVIGGMPNYSESMMLPDGTTVMSSMLGASGIHVLGELPAGTEIPMLGMPNGQVAPDFAALAGSGIFPGATSGMYPGPGSGAYAGMAGYNGSQPMMGFPQTGSNDFVSQQNTGGLPQAFPQRASEEEERLRQQLAAYSRLLDDWIQFTEEKWRTVSDSQLGWKPLRGRWSGWEDIFQDVYAAKTSDPMAQAAQDAGEATSRRFENSKEKGSAASSVACFLRDMMTLRRGLEIMQSPSGRMPETPTVQPAVQSHQKVKFAGNGGLLQNGTGSGKTSQRNSLIRRPAPIYVDADTDK